MLILGILENAPCIPEIKIVEFLAYGIHSRGLGICIPRYNRAIKRRDRNSFLACGMHSHCLGPCIPRHNRAIREQIGIYFSPAESTQITIRVMITEQ